ncbi:MAG: hypothetical protein AAFX55_05350 [Bacteroidota bacterium]
MADEKGYTEDNIQALDGMQHVRMRPQMYFERCFKEQTLNAFIFESLCHALDEYYDNLCSNIQVELYETAFKITYKSGMSLEVIKNEDFTIAEAIMTKIGACSNMKKHLHVGHRYCNIGMASVNAASEVCRLKTVSNHKKGIFVFEKGKTTTKLLMNDVQEENSTELYFKLDMTLFKGLKFTYDGIRAEIESIQSDFKGLEFKLFSHIK